MEKWKLPNEPFGLHTPNCNSCIIFAVFYAIKYEVIEGGIVTRHSSEEALPRVQSHQNNLGQKRSKDKQRGKQSPPEVSSVKELCGSEDVRHNISSHKQNIAHKKHRQ